MFVAVNGHDFNRAFFVSLDNYVSEARTINCEVPQVSILGPLLFLLYINDISQALSSSHAYLQAEDSSIFIKIMSLLKSKMF